MRKYLLIFSLVFYTVALTAQTSGDIIVKRWSGDKKSAFSFSFDDSFLSQYENAGPILNSFGFKGTFYVKTEEINEYTPNGRYGSWQNFREMANEGHEIGAHTVTHEHLTELPLGDKNTPGTVHYEMYQSKEDIKEHIPGYVPITFAYPFAEYNNKVRNAAKLYYESARADGTDPNDYSLSENEWYTLTAYEVLFDEPRNSPSDDEDDLEEFFGWSESVINHGKWGILLAHEVVPFSELNELLDDGAWYPITNEFLSDMCEGLKEYSDNNDLWVATIENVTKYIKERDNFYYNIISQTDTLIQFDISDALDNDIYNYPLTADIYVPADWDTVIFKQDGNEQILLSSSNDGDRYISVEINPAGDDIIIKKKEYIPPPPVEKYSVLGSVTYHNMQSTPLELIKVKLQTSNNESFITYTDSNGDYSFDNLLPGSYTISFSKENNWGGVNATDALEVARYFAGQIELDSLQQISGDVNDNSLVNSTDALLILRRFSGEINAFTIPDWLFQEDNVQLEINDEDLELDNKAIAAGDVNKSYTP